MPNVSVLIAEDHQEVRKGLSALLSMEQDIELIGEAEDGNEAVMMVMNLCPDVVIMDITMPVLSGMDALKQIKITVPETKVLMLTMHISKQYVQNALQEGASGYLLKDVTHEEFIDAIRTVYKGDIALSPSIH